MSRPISRLSAGGIRKNWRALATVTAVAILALAIIAVVATAPISEMKVFVRNEDESDTANVTIVVGESSMNLNILPHETLVWKFHVSPGTHTLLASCSYDGQPNSAEEFIWTMHVGFMCVSYYWILVSEEETRFDGNPPSIIAGSDPLTQALSDSSVMVPIYVLSGAIALTCLAFWNLFRAPPRKGPKQPTGPT